MSNKCKKYLINTLKNSKVYIVPLDDAAYTAIIKDFNNISNQYETNKFIDKWGFKPSDILMQGETYIDQTKKDNFEFFNKIAKRIIPCECIKNNETGENKIVYKCWCAKPLNLQDVVNHRTPLESWNCLMVRIGEPQYAIVIEEKIK